jgi:hypothetical protein
MTTSETEIKITITEPEIILEKPILTRQTNSESDTLFEEIKDEPIVYGKYDLLRMMNDYDENGVSYDWLEVRDELCIHGVKALPLVFDYYQNHSNNFDSWTNFLFACSHFTDAELDLGGNRSMRRIMTMKLKKLLALRSKNQNQNIHQFLRENKKIIA